MKSNARAGTLPASGSGNGEMDRARYHVRELVELERALMGNDSWHVS
jgi:hypothetical protein